MTEDGNDGFSLKQEATVPKLSQSIVLGAEFQSYHDFNAVLDTYCQQNAISNTPLAFVKRNQKRLLTNTFGDDLLNQQTIDRFVYQSLSLICVHHRSNSSNKDGLFCEGRITIRYIRSKNVLQISSFITKHSNHKTEHITQHPNHHASVHSSYNDSSSSLRTAQLNRIFGLIHRMQDNGALDLVENVCQTILEKWDGDNDGLEIHLVEKVINDPHQNDLPAVSGSGTAAAATELPSIKMEMLSQGNRSFYIDGNDNTIQDEINDDHLFDQYSSLSSSRDTQMDIKCERKFNYSD